MSFEYLFNLATAVMDAAGTAAILYVLWRYEGLGKIAGHRILLWFGAVGLFGQAIRNAIFLFTGESLSDNELPLWIFKDFSLAALGIVMAAVTYKKHGRKKRGKTP